MTQTIHPEFIRLPKAKTLCPHTGMSRSSMANLTVPSKANDFRPAVPAKCLRRQGNVRGLWLVPFEALLAYLHALPTGVEEAAKREIEKPDSNRTVNFRATARKTASH
ncbi:MAG: hypothetical protein Q8N18_25145 [Opitutaceae bacterium]|nr:hypothetical protein [Opitutaceae bacterium]